MNSPDEILSTSTPALAVALPSDQPQHSSRDVTGRDLLVILFATLFAYAFLVGTATGLLLLYSEIQFNAESPWIVLLLLAPVHPILLGNVWLRMRGRWTSAAQWGLGQFRWAYLPVGLVVAGAFAGLSELVDPLNFEFKLKIRGDLPAALVFGFLAAGCAPFVEELVFRGMVYRWLTLKIQCLAQCDLERADLRSLSYWRWLDSDRLYRASRRCLCRAIPDNKNALAGHHRACHEQSYFCSGKLSSLAIAVCRLLSRLPRRSSPVGARRPLAFR